jgi:hypothetical protein
LDQLLFAVASDLRRRDTSGTVDIAVDEELESLEAAVRQLPSVEAHGLAGLGFTRFRRVARRAFIAAGALPRPVAASRRRLSPRARRLSPAATRRGWERARFSVPLTSWHVRAF